MQYRITCGIIQIDRGAYDAGPAGMTQALRDFSSRLRFHQECLSLNAVFSQAWEAEDGKLNIPFFSADDGTCRAPKMESVVKELTPYEIAGVHRLDIAKVDPMILCALRPLFPGPAPAVTIDDITPTAPAPHIEKPEDVFEGLIGLEGPKRIVLRLSNVLEKHGKDALGSFHMIFVGDAGTGKTELAQRMVPLLDAIGVTDGTNKFCKVGEAELVAKYVGQTAPKVKRAVEKALGGVLFIDEFYAIANAPHYGREAIDTLVDQVETHRGDFVCIVAGYAREVDEVLDLNPGLRSRFGFRVEFPSYSDEELASIFMSMANKRGFAVADTDTLTTCTRKLRTTRAFANARTMRNLVDKAVIEASWTHDEPTIYSGDLVAATDELFERGRAVGF